MEAYCMKCKAKREMASPSAEFNKSGAPVTLGTCPECGTRMYRTGKTEAHEGLQAPVYKKPEPKRHGNLVIVESPAKAKTVGRFLGKGYTVKASIGHIRDLLKSQLSVDVDNDFTPKYRVPNEKKAIVKELKTLAKTHDQVFLATDPDREGEAISWHLAEALETDPARTHRVTFHEITQSAIEEAFANSRDIDRHLVDAQQARRVLDRLVGYSISPILWEKVRSRLSAGRVQSVALRLIVDRENEINDFIPQEYWSIHADFKPEHEAKRSTYTAKLVRINDAELNLTGKAEVEPLLPDMEAAAYSVNKVKRGERKRKPSAPFITSTLQQEAYRKLGYTAKRTMALAQRLYEGIDLPGNGSTGLITYMRTDSTNVAVQAQREAAKYIREVHGDKFLPPTPPMYTTRAKGAQEAHESIRPTSVFRTPESVKSFMDAATFKLYQLIWQRFVASQMESAIFDTIAVDILGNGKQSYLFRATGSITRFAGFLAIYEESHIDDKRDDPNAEENVKIPATIAENQAQEISNINPEQHFTQPPARFSEATLVQELEAEGIGRPSTYAPIISTIQDRGYVTKVENKRLAPTQTGTLVNDLMMQYFPEVVDVKFTAGLEEKLDDVAEGTKNWVSIMGDFYNPFAEQLKIAQAEMPVAKAGYESIGRACPECGRDLVIRYGKFGKFISCGGFPECRYTEPWLEKIGIECPKDHGDLVERKSRKGRVFYGCANYPSCDFNSWKRPHPAKCPNCKGLLVINNKREVVCLDCNETFLIENLTVEAMA